MQTKNRSSVILVLSELTDVFSLGLINQKVQA